MKSRRLNRLVCIGLLLIGWSLCPGMVRADAESDAVKEKAEQFFKIQYSAVEQVSGHLGGSGSSFDGWTPENFNFQGAMTSQNGKSLLASAIIAYMFKGEANSLFEYIVTAADGKDYFKIPKDLASKMLNEHYVLNKLPNVLPYWDAAAGACMIPYTDGFGGEGLYDYLSVQKLPNGNWKVTLNRPGTPSFAPELKQGTMELSANHRVVSIRLDLHLSSLTWKSRPQNDSLKVGQSLDLSGAVLQAQYEGATWEVPVDASMLSEVDSSKVGKQTIQVRYYDKTVTFEITRIGTATTPTPTNKPTTTQKPPTTTRIGQVTTTRTVGTTSSDTPLINTTAASTTAHTTDSQSTSMSDHTGNSSGTEEPSSKAPVFGIILCVLAALIIVGGGITGIVLYTKHKRP